MSRDYYTLDELVLKLGRERRQVEKMVSRGLIPGRRVGGEWRFNEIELTQWLEQELRAFGETDLAQLEQQQQQSTELCRLTPVTSLLSVETWEVPLDAGTKPSVLQSLIEVAGRSWHVWDPAAILRAVKDREDVMSTGFDNGVAIPHPRNPQPEAIGQSVIAFGRTLSGIPFGAPSRVLTDIFFLVLARDSATHLQILARLGRMMQLPDFVSNLREAETSGVAYDVIAAADREIGN
ncbi:MAG: PTS sugar transporter subunit IIA [Planctomycetaceae bacterium]|nr:PTS sugar transporter subunit IIA [Planctomycetaceae bacterium]